VLGLVYVECVNVCFVHVWCVCVCGACVCCLYDLLVCEERVWCPCVLCVSESSVVSGTMRV
jgi:hypothetical protein